MCVLGIRISLLRRCPYSELLWSTFSRIQTEYGDLSVLSPNLGNCGPESLRIRTLFTQYLLSLKSIIQNLSFWKSYHTRERASHETRHAATRFFSTWWVPLIFVLNCVIFSGLHSLKVKKSLTDTSKCDSSGDYTSIHLKVSENHLLF